MLPSLGLFSSLECPFYNGGAGQCSRPYCHYRHAKKDPNSPSEPSEEAQGQQIPNNDAPQTTDDAKAGTSSEPVYKSRSSLYKAIVDAAPAYSPTPIAQLKSSHIPIPYTPTIPTRSSAVKKSKPSSEYVPHYIGTSRPTYVPPYCPTSISSLNSQNNTPGDPLKNPLYELYGPEGAQYSPNDVDPVGTGYSYAPGSTSYMPYSPEYVPSKVNYNPQFSPPDSQLSDDDDNVDLAAETAAQTNGDPGGGENLIDLSELDNLELEFEDDIDNGGDSGITEDNLESSGNKEISDESNVMDIDSSRVGTDVKIKSSSSQKAEKRRSSSTSSTSDSKKLKSSNENTEKIKMEPSKEKVSQTSSDKNGHKEKKSSSSSSSKKSSSSSSSSTSKKSTSHSSSKSSSSSSKSSKSSSSDVKKSHSSESKGKSGSSSSSSSNSKHKEKHRDREKSKDKEKLKDKEKDRTHEKIKDKDKDKERNKDSKSSKKSSHRSSDDKDKGSIQREKIEEEIRKLEVELDASLEDEDMIEQQCYEMFNEYSESLQNQPVTEKIEDQRITVNEEPVATASSKKRIAHQAPHSSMQPNPKPAPTLAKKCSPYQVMRDRWELLKKEKMQALETKKASLAVAPALVPKAPVPTPYSLTNAPQASLPGSGLAAGKKRIAGVPNVAMLLKPPTTSTPTSSSSSLGTPPSRFYNKTSQRVDEFGRVVKVRVAHAPNMDTPAMRKPVVNPSDCRKFKVATRQANVNKLFQAYIDAGFGDAAHDMALESERNSTNGTESLGVYSHRIIQILKDLRACAVSSQNGPKMDGMSGIPNRVVSHNAMIAGKLGAKVSWSIQTAKKEDQAKPNLSLYEQLQSYILTKEQLEENGFPMPSAEKGGASIKPSSYRSISQPTDPHQKICVRCLKPYAINKRGEQVKEEECFYHWGRKYKRYREETKYSCCDSAGSGCSVSPYHVFEQNWEKSTGYMSTLSKPWMESDPGVYALDCEMCYTTGGLELTRVTVIKGDLSVAYETLVKPAHKILDYNTRFSGITEEDLKDITTTILQVQATLLGMFCDKTILVGHSLESDLKALKLIHPTVVDTSVVFPHKMGPPQKRALRNLAADYLKKIIQNDVGGHDSKEDAVAALELMLWRLKEDEKTR